MNAILFLLAFLLAPSGPGAIWTTTGSCGEPQDVNHYYVGQDVFYNGSGFPQGDFDWNINEVPPIPIPVAKGTYTVDETGNFCFYAYTIKSSDAGEYKASFDGKFDNYRVVGPDGFVILNSFVFFDLDSDGILDLEDHGISGIMVCGDAAVEKVCSLSDNGSVALVYSTALPGSLVELSVIADRVTTPNPQYVVLDGFDLSAAFGITPYLVYIPSMSR